MSRGSGKTPHVMNFLGATGAKNRKQVQAEAGDSGKHSGVWDIEKNHLPENKDIWDPD